jgi:hypothetical protein
MKQKLSKKDKAVLSRRFIDAETSGRKTARQHTSPCADCPWARTALPSWLGTLTSEEWLAEAHGEHMIQCHSAINQQCAGAAIFRTHVHKLPKRREVITLPADKQVFETNQEFTDHHVRFGLPHE